jgi:ATP-dependent DNA helicase RecG
MMLGRAIRQLPLEFADIAVLTVEEIWNGATAAALVQLREDKRIERKPVGIHGAELAEYLSMWANTIDGGLIVIGMEDDGRISGCEASGRRTNKLETEAKNNCPEARFESKRIPADREGGQPDYLLLIRVYYNPRKVVKTSKGDAYIRVGNQKRKLRHEEVTELETSRRQPDIEQEPCPNFRFPDDFDSQLLSDYVSSVRRRHPNYPASLTVPELLELRHLGKRDPGRFVPNTACVLMFARDPTSEFPGCKVRFLRHEGEIEGTGAKWNVVKDLMVEGPIPILVEGTAQILRQQLREFSRLGPDGKFVPAPEYPEEAWVEAVVNACVHRSYGVVKNMNIFVRMFDDRLEVESPGGFPPPVTPQNIYDLHQPRNPHLMDAMLHLNYVQCAREGTRRMRESMTAAALPDPLFSQRDATYDIVRVLLRNNKKQRKEWIDSDAAAVVGAEIAATLTEHERRAVNFIAEHKKAHAAEISRLCSIDWNTARRLLQRLTARGILKHIHRKDILRDSKAHFILATPKDSV